MLTRLHIENLILVQECVIEFKPGFTVLTGESGAGKSVMLSALSLLLGQKLDSGLIRHGEEFARIEGCFEQLADELFPLLDEAGITYDKDEPLIIRRELTIQGKSRSFVNNQAASAALLKKMAPHIVLFCSQHAHTELFDLKYQQELLDRYAGAVDDVKAFQKVHSQLAKLKAEIATIEGSVSQRVREIETAKREIEEIASANLKEGEDEELFLEFTRCTNDKELESTLFEINEILDGERFSCLKSLAKVKPYLDKLMRQSPHGAVLLESYTSATNELKELSYEITKWQRSSLDATDALTAIEARLNTIEELKKKYGKTVAEIFAYKKSQEEKLFTLENQDAKLFDLKTLESSLQEEENSLAALLTKKRKAASGQLAKKVTNELEELNMQGALFEIDLAADLRTHTGDEAVHFYLQANKGLKRQPIIDAASGGELSRIILALQCSLIEKGAPRFFVFDEIDANVGGETAAKLGEKLLQLATGRQVIAITHFAQVATQAEQHMRISKISSSKTTHSQIELLDDPKQKHEELSRMVGGIFAL